MKNVKWFTLIILVVLMLVSCQKKHYDFDGLEGVNAEGELLLPLATGSYTVMDFMERFQIDSMLTFDATGDMYYHILLNRFRTIDGEDLLRFKDMEINEYYAIENPNPGHQIDPVDTVVRLTQSIVFTSDHIHALSATMRSGRFAFNMTSNVGQIQEVVITSSNIIDTDGHDLRFVYRPGQGMNSFALEGLRYETTEVNTLNLNYEVRFVAQGYMPSEFEFGLRVEATDLAIQEMWGYVDTYDSRNRIDTTFKLFPNNVTGILEIENAEITLSERNTFPLDAKLFADTALVWGEGVSPYSILDPLPLVADAPVSMDFMEVCRTYADGRVNAHQGNVFASLVIRVNPNGVSDLVSVSDTCGIDLKVDVSVPFAFKAESVHYLDTIGLNLSGIDSPKWVKKLTLGLTFVSTIPFRLNGTFYMYDSENNCVIGTLLQDATLIEASYDGSLCTTSVTVEITEKRLLDFFQSDSLIMDYGIDTESHGAVLNSGQFLRYSVKADVEYENDGVD